MPLPAIDASVYRELWVSLVSLIRSYAAGYDFGGAGSRSAIRDGADGTLELSSGGKVLRIRFDPDSAQGLWELSSDDCQAVEQSGSFTVGLDSTVRFSDRMGKLELDVAAEAFTARILDQN